MENARGGHYQQSPGSQGGHVQAQFPAYAAAGGQYYGMMQQQQQQQLNYQYFGVPHPQQQQQQQQAMGHQGFGGPFQQQQQHFTQQQIQPGAALQQQQPQQAPPPPPPPPGEGPNKQAAPPISTHPNSVANSAQLPPLLPPPLPPMFPWMSPALAESMTSSRFGKSFEEQASNLPFVPIIVNDTDLAKMTENVIKEAEQTKTQQLQYYKEVVSQDLPRSLLDMFQPLYCKLCTLTLSSPVVAKDHYQGKRHKKAIESWIQKNGLYPEITGNSGMNKPRSDMDGGGMMGPINGFITKQQNQNPPNRNGSAAPPPPSLSQQQPRQPTANVSQPQRPPSSAPPHPLLPGLIGGRQQQQQQLPPPQQQNFERKRPAAAAPLPSLTKNTQPQKSTSIAEKLLAIAGNSGLAPGKPTPPPPPAFGKFGIADNSNFGMKSDNSNSSGSKAPPAQAKQQAPMIGPVWVKPSSANSSNLNSEEFQQQPAKKPRLEGKDSGGKTDAIVPVPRNKQAAPPPPSLQQNKDVGQTTAGVAPTPSPTPVPTPSPSGSSTSGTATNPPSGQGEAPAFVPRPKGLCRVCNVQLSSPTMANQHFNGKNHKAKVADLEEQGEPIPPPIMPPPSLPKPPPDASQDQVNEGGPGPGPANNKPFGNRPGTETSPALNKQFGNQPNPGGPRPGNNAPIRNQGPRPANNAQFGNQNQLNRPQFSDKSGSGPGPRRGGGGGGGGPRHPNPNNNRNNNQRNNNSNNNRFNRGGGGRNNGPRYFK